MKKSIINSLAIFTLILLTGLLSTLTVSAENYVSYEGKFYITIPDDWTQVDYRTVDAFLARNKASTETFQYEAVFAPKTSLPFFAGDYLILNVDSVGEMSQERIDSTLTELKKIFGKSIKYEPVSNLLADLKSSTPVYDEKMKTVSIINRIVENGQPVKKNLLVMKFYDQGIASFYFYSPDSLYEQSHQIFLDIINSFSSENYKDAAPKENLKIADVDKRDYEAENPVKETASGNNKNLLFWAVAVVLIIIIITRRKKRK